MAYEIPGFMCGILPANADYSVEATYQYTAVKAIAATATTGTGAGGAAVSSPAASGDPILGVMQNNPLLGEAATVMVHGISKAQIQGTVAIGDLLMAVPGGKLAVATSGKYQVAQALESGADSDIVSVLLVRNGKL
jgi:hypothetical protein